MQDRQLARIVEAAEDALKDAEGHQMVMTAAMANHVDETRQPSLETRAGPLTRSGDDGQPVYPSWRTLNDVRQAHGLPSLAEEGGSTLAPKEADERGLLRRRRLLASGLEAMAAARTAAANASSPPTEIDVSGADPCDCLKVFSDGMASVHPKLSDEEQMEVYKSYLAACRRRRVWQMSVQTWDSSTQEAHRLCRR